MWNLQKYSNNIAMIDENEQIISYLDIQMFIKEIRSFCSQRDTVLCLCKNTIGAILGYLAFIELRVVPILLEASIERDFINKICANYDSYYIWAPEEIDFEEYHSCTTMYKYRLWRTRKEIKHTIHQDLAVLLTTSGTTGSSKMVRLSYENLSSNAHSIINYLQISQEERPIMALPMCYAYGLSVVNSHIISGATLLVTTKSIIQKEFWKMVISHKATSISGVPYTYQLLERMHFCEWDLPFLRTLTQAGGKIPERLQYLFAKYASDHKKKFVIMYGQCEATARIAYLSPQYALSKIGSIGQAIPKGKLEIVDEKGEKIESSNCSGELVYSGPNIMMGYAEKLLDLKLGNVQGTILFTGDVGYFDEDGFYYIIGRKKRFIKLFGKRVSLDEVENYLKNICGENCACIEKNGKLFVLLTDIKRKTRIQEILIKQLKIPAIVLEIREISEIPRGVSGKIQYSKMKDYVKL